ncbi:Beta-mannanase/endoglucanase A precursor [compost metagenome]
MGSSNVSGTFVKMAHPVTGAEYYVEIIFGQGAGTLAPCASTGDIQIRINKTDWTHYSESDDYSYDASKQTYADWDKVTLFSEQFACMGVEP